LAALLGLFGAGPLSRAAVGSGESPLSVEEYERFLRFGKPTTLRVRFDPVSRGEARVWLSRDYLESFRLQKVTPEPDSVEAGPDRLTYVFEVNDPDRPVVATLSLQPEKIGHLEGQVGLDDVKQLSFDQFVYP